MGSFIERTYFSYIPSREERGRQQAARAPGLRAEGVGFSLCVWAWLDLAFGFFRPGGRGPAETPAVRWMGRGGGGASSGWLRAASCHWCPRTPAWTPETWPGPVRDFEGVTPRSWLKVTVRKQRNSTFIDEALQTAPPSLLSL